jgi:hypothetical protein
MKVVSVVPLQLGKPTLGTLLDETERRLRGKGTTLIRHSKRRWVHTKYPGWISWEVSKGGMLVAEVRAKKGDAEWQLLQSFIGYLDRHLGKYVDSISILYYPD